MKFSWVMNVFYLAFAAPILMFSIASGDLAKTLESLPTSMNPGLLVFIGLAFVGILYPVFFIMSSGFIHLGCLMFGANNNGYNGTASAVGYGYSLTGPLQLIPCVNVLAGFYQIYLSVVSLMHFQKTTAMRAIAAILWPLPLLCICYAFLLIPLLGKAGSGF